MIRSPIPSPCSADSGTGSPSPSPTAVCRQRHTGEVRFARSLDGGASWSAAITVHADDQTVTGNVFFLFKAIEATEVPVAVLTYFAYPLLKQPGDPVASGEAIATVGASGGNEETGLYFELRHLGRAFDPLGWARR